MHRFQVLDCDDYD